jgi:ribonuclease D
MTRQLPNDAAQAIPTISALFLDEKVLKFGVGIMEDASRLRADFSLEVHGCIDLQKLARGINTRYPRSLQGLADFFIGFDLIQKPKSVAMSDWSTEALSKIQVDYAAQDAWLGAALFHKILEAHPSCIDGVSIATGNFEKTRMRPETKLRTHPDEKVANQENLDAFVGEALAILQEMAHTQHNGKIPIKGTQVRRLVTPAKAKQLFRGVRAAGFKSISPFVQTHGGSVGLRITKDGGTRVITLDSTANAVQ